MPKVSVIIPTYNRANLITDTIQSVLEQSFRDFEIIVIDDGSTDNTREIVSAFPVRYFRQENQGVAAARNKGIEAAQGEYIALLDSDDILLESTLRKGVEVLDSYPQVAFSYGQAYLMDEKGVIIRLRNQNGKQPYVRVREGSEEIKELLTRGNYICTPTVLARRRYLYDVGLFDTTFRYGSEDFDLLVRLAKKYAVAYIAEPLVKYRIHPGSIGTARKLEEIEQSHRLIIEGVLSDAGVGPLLSSQRPIAYFYLYLRLANYAYGSNDKRVAREYLLKALQTHPGVFFQKRFLSWVSQFARTELPLPVLGLARQATCYMRRSTRQCQKPRSATCPIVQQKIYCPFF
jgi:glycosyltransferase involved in cell wall biosynthesis